MTVTQPFERKADKAPKKEMNRLIMDYLVNEGYPDAAHKFAAEANLAVTSNFGNIIERVRIREAIHSGNLQTAIEKINELDPQLLDTDDSLHFSLLRLQLVELIRVSTRGTGEAMGPEIVTAIEFASTHLAPIAPTKPEFLADFERTMALLLFPPERLNAEQREILNPALRRQVASRVNAAILGSQGIRREAQIRKLVRKRAWAEKMAKDSKKIDIPAGGLDFGLDEDINTEAMTRSGVERNGNGNGAVGGADDDGDTAMREGDGAGS